MSERITLPLSHEERQYLRDRRSEVVQSTVGQRQRLGLRDTHEAWVAEVDAAIGVFEHVMAGNKAETVKSRLAALS